MFLRFEDWSRFLSSLDKKGIPHGGRIIKVYTSDQDPRELFGKPKLVVFESETHPFTDETFSMGERGVFSGVELEEKFSATGLTEKGKEIARALLRFSTREDTGFTQDGMLLTGADGSFLIDHPTGDIHRFEDGAKPGHEGDMHLDVFEPNSLLRMKELVGYDNPAQIISFQERLNFNREGGASRGKER